jgi:hypothetical protein
MEVKRKSPRRRTRLAGAAFSILVVLAVSAPNAAAADKDFKGWFAALDLALTQPNSLDQHFGDSINAANPSATKMSRLVLKNDSDGTLRASVGYGFGLGFGSLQASYWSFDNEDSTSGSFTGVIAPAIFGYGYNGAMYVLNPTFTAGSKVKATTVDLDYVRPMDAGEQFTVKWLAGLRVATYEEDQAWQATSGTTSYTYRQGKHMESDAIGLKVGASALFDFTRHFSVEGGMAFSFLQGSNKGRSFQTFVDRASFVCGTPPCSDFDESKDDRTRGEIRDFDLKAVWTVGDLEYYVGYSASFWDGLVKDPVPAGGNFFVSPGSEGPSRDGISFNSLHGGIVWRFAGRQVTGGGP